MALSIDPGILLIVVFFALIFLKVPIAISLGVSGMLLVYLQQLGTQMFAPVFFANISKFSLLAIPYFILAGVVMGKAKISDKLIHLISLLVGPVRGGLATVTVIAALFWGAVSGSGPATVAAIGTILIPGMIKAGYDRGFSAAIVSAASGLAIVIPPSIGYVVYGTITGASISKLFIGGIIPGIVVGICLIVAGYIISVIRDYRGEAWGTLSEVWRAFKEAIWAIISPLIILGGIYGGVFTPTEAAAVSIFYGLFVGFFIYKTLTLKDLYDLLVEASVSTAVVMLVVSFAGIFGWAMTTLGFVERVSQFAISLTSNQYILLFVINVILFIAGMLMDAISIYYITLPLLMPIMAYFNWDPVWFGVVMTINLAIGQITPPVAVNLYVGANIAKVSIDEISRNVIPFVAAAVIGLLIVMYVPIITTWLPSLMIH
ncbi:MAG: TRAP transporter large permease [Thermoanaerobacteraceae bacterium]|nr:TRAP transporter large permease [Thermoanaerobacteraceae bacterium]